MIRAVVKRHTAQIGAEPQDDHFTRPTKEATYIDAETGEWIASYHPGLAKSLRNHALAMRGRPVEHLEPQPLPFELQPFVNLIAVAPAIVSTVTENAPPTKIHSDNWTSRGDVEGRSTAIICYRDGEFTGGEYALVEYGLAFDLQDGDVLLAGTKVLHGNLPREGENYMRLTIIMCLDGQPSEQ